MDEYIIGNRKNEIFEHVFKIYVPDKYKNGLSKFNEIQELKYSGTIVFVVV